MNNLKLEIVDTDYKMVEVNTVFAFAVRPNFSFHFFSYSNWIKTGFTFKDYMYSRCTMIENFYGQLYMYKQIVFCGFGLVWFKKLK